ncbi:hypothetical protein CK203_036587 [Vitis vinifera]|uniref:Uncharacterized protein n=1 Tax=Vitis vinifera TaxID=29760 RepID=A0A438HZL5_VITVI|nr:hypothetical protein CK203_036587 [Vitis vinifera]
MLPWNRGIDFLSNELNLEFVGPSGVRFFTWEASWGVDPKSTSKKKLNLLFLFFYLQDKPKKEGPMSVEEAVDDSENLTDFLLDFEEDE